MLAAVASPDQEVITSDQNFLNGIGDAMIGDIANPNEPQLVGEYGVLDDPMLGVPFYVSVLQGGDARTLDHSARFNESGTRLYLSYWDAGVIMLDVRDPSNPFVTAGPRSAPFVGRGPSTRRVLSPRSSSVATRSCSSRHENAPWRLCPGPAVASSDPGQGALLGERRRVGRFARWASSPCFSFGRPCDLPGLCCEHVSVCVVVPLVLPFAVNRGVGGEDVVDEVGRSSDRAGCSP